ncbi:NAD-dependent epimerase/dehydratase family protein [Streptomyces sp. NPDC056437]|uniref:NAD-dependent epimerase/dehydratase family protein n=1 Tax=Streptomyces sp. NPDC056437 TaxID=3345816 RepID=UPI0036A11182
MAPVRVSGAVMVHPRRMHIAMELIRSARRGFLDIVLDPEPEAPVSLRTAIRAWASVPRWATHHLVLEDDALLSTGFTEQAERAAAAAPDDAIAFYSNWNARNGGAVRLGALAGARWVTSAAEYTPTVALMLPAEIAEGFEPYARRYGDEWPDDVVMARYLSQAGVRTLIAVPNLVQHGTQPSLSDNDFHGLRLAACLAPDPGNRPWCLSELLEPEVVPYFEFGVAQCQITYPGQDRRLTVGSRRFAPYLGIESAQCSTDLVQTLTADPGMADMIHDALPATTVEELWNAAYVLGFLGQRHSGGDDVEKQIAFWTSDPLVDSALHTLGPGGLCTSFGAQDLFRLSGPLRALTWRGVCAGARMGAGAQRGMGVTSRKQPSRDVSIASTNTGLAHCLANDLTDRGHRARVVSRDDEMADDVMHSLEDSDLLVYALCAADTSEPFRSETKQCEEVLRLARSAGIGHVVLMYFSDSGADWPTGGELIALDSPAVTWLRLGTPYGPELTGLSPINSLVHHALRRRTLTLRSDPRFHLVHVWDIAELLDRLLRSGPAASARHDLRHGRPISLRDLASVIGEVVHPVDVVFALEEPGDTSEEPGGHGSDVHTGASDGTGLLGHGPAWEPALALPEGIRTVAQWLAYEAEDQQ